MYYLQKLLELKLLFSDFWLSHVVYSVPCGKFSILNNLAAILLGRVRKELLYIVKNLTYRL